MKSPTANCNICGTVEDVSHNLVERARTESLYQKKSIKMFNRNFKNVGVLHTLVRTFANPFTR